MLSISLTPVRFITADDIYHYSVDNRPLQDIDGNVTVLKNAITTLANSYTTLPSNIVVPTSGVAYQNTQTYTVDLLVSGGTVTAITFSRDNVTYYSTGVVSGTIRLSPGDYVKFTYSVVPTVIAVPR